MLAALLLGCPSSAPSPQSAAGECTVLLGVCAPLDTAEAFCGRAATPRAGGCVRHACKPGEALELDDGRCLPASMTHGLLTHDEQDTRIASCEGGVVERPTAASDLVCAAGPFSCRRGEHWSGTKETKRCEPLPLCAENELFDEASSRCVRVKRATVDVGTWARLALGPDGGEGTSAFCAPIRQKASTSSRFRIGLTFTDNDVTQLVVHLDALPPTSSAASDAAEKSINDLTKLLRFIGGEANAASVSLDLVCTAAQASPPVLKPR